MLTLVTLPLRAHYFIAIKKNDGNVLETLNDYTPLLPPKGKFYADPFLFKQDGIHYIFFEEYDYKKGVISYVTLGQDDSISEPKIALELPIHLSFPYLFQEGNEIYMVPETYPYKSISLYKAVRFPDRWERKRILVHGKNFSDPILFKHNGYYWLFTAIQTDILQIFYAIDLDSPFRPHPINTKRIRGRNAGPLYYQDGKMIRPTMNCKPHYGYSMTLKEITQLTPTEFQERAVATIQPTWTDHLIGTHTYCQNETYVVYDGKTTD